MSGAFMNNWEELREVGFSPDSASYVAKKAVQAKMVKMLGKGAKTYYVPVKS